jgi:hypothetical protein
MILSAKLFADVGPWAGTLVGFAVLAIAATGARSVAPAGRGLDSLIAIGACTVVHDADGQVMAARGRDGRIEPAR